MKRIATLAVFSHKPCWSSVNSPTGYATNGGFPFQMRAISELFSATRLVVPCSPVHQQPGETALTGHNLSVVPLTAPSGSGLQRKLVLPIWLLRNLPVMLRECLRADAVHAPVPGDIGTIGMLLAFVLRKPLFVRHCGNWHVANTAAERFWKWFMQRFAGGRNVMLATGGGTEQPSPEFPKVRWIFSTSLTQPELAACAMQRERRAGQPLRLILVARQEQDKGTGNVIASLPALLKEFHGLSFDVVGEGGALGEFKQQAAALKLNGCVTFHGNVNHDAVLNLLRGADLFVMPTTSSEGFPKAVLEALACGLPVVTTRVSVLPKLLQTGGGVLLDSPEPSAVAQGVRDCVSDPERYRAMSARAVEVARQYSLEGWRDFIGEQLRAAWGPLSAHD